MAAKQQNKFFGNLVPVTGKETWCEPLNRDDRELQLETAVNVS
jgi:hypothetical protein